MKFKPEMCNSALQFMHFYIISYLFLGRMLLVSNITAAMSELKGATCHILSALFLLLKKLAWKTRFIQNSDALLATEHNFFDPIN